MNWRTVARMVAIRLLTWLDRPTTPARVTPDMFSPAERLDDALMLRRSTTRRGIKTGKPATPSRNRRPAR